jgi:PAS domain S-box-containing protein
MSPTGPACPTERKEDERLLQDSEELFRKVFENSPIGMTLVTRDFRFFSVNPAWVAMTGYTEAELLTMSFRDITHPDYRATDAISMRELAEGSIPVYITEKKYIRKGGSTLWGYIRVTAIRDQQGTLLYFAGQIEDITERKRAGEALRESEEKNRTLISSVDAGIILQSASGRILTWNPAAEQVFGVSAEKVLEQVSTDISWHCVRQDGSPFPATEHPSMITLSTGKPLRDVIMGVTSSTGRFSWITISTNPLFRDGESTPHAVVISFTDITDRKAAEDALRENEKVLADIIEKNPLSIQIVDTDGFTQKVNPAHTLLFGSVPPPDFSIFADLQAKQPALEDLILCAKSGEVVHLPDMYFNPHDSYPDYPDVPVWVRAIIFPLNDPYGKPERFVLMHENITGRKTAEDALRKRTEELGDRNRLISTLLDTAPVGIFMVDAPSGRPMIANAAATRLLGRGVLPAATEENLADVYEAYRTGTSGRYPTAEMPIVRGMQGESSHIDDMVVVRPDGTRTLLEIFGNPVFDSQDHIIASLVCFLDITERKKAEDALRDLNLYNRNLIEISIDPLVTISPEGKIQDVNIATETATGLKRDDLIGTDFSEYFTEPEKAREGYLRVLSEGKVIDYPLEIRHLDGQVLPVLYNATVYRNGSGNIQGVFAAARDITERKRAEELRENLIAELGKKNDELDRFTYTVSHDLKSPLLSIRAFLALLEGDIKTGNTGGITHDIQRISESAEKMELLITTLLTLSRSGRSVSTALPVPLTDLAREAAGLLDVSLKQSGVRLVIPDNLPVVTGDRPRLLQVMTNLLDNAVKFMGGKEEPRIEITVRAGTGAPVFCVRDNGMGIRQENLEKVFGLFERFSPDIPGTGIGLATVKRIIEAHGGKVWVESEGEGKGTTVCFTLPSAGDHLTDTHNN